MDVPAWLRNLGLNDQAFRDNEIDADVLPKLTAEDLKALGVTPIGHRRKLLEAIAELGTATMPAGRRRHLLGRWGQSRITIQDRSRPTPNGDS
jgi:SAM domain (Sterile alpha motif)